MLNVSAFLADTVTLSQMADCSVTDTLAAPFMNELVVHQMFEVMDPAATTHSLLQNAPDRVVNRIHIRAAWWPVLRPDEVRRLG